MAIQLILALVSSGTIHGYVVTLRQGMLNQVVGAAVTADGTNLGAMTDENGEFSFEIPPGKYMIWFNSVGMRQARRLVHIREGEVSELSTVLYDLTGSIAFIWPQSPTGLSGYVVARNGYPLSGIVIEVPEAGIIDTTSLGRFRLGPFSGEQSVRLSYDGILLDSTRIISPALGEALFILKPFMCPEISPGPDPVQSDLSDYITTPQ